MAKFIGRREELALLNTLYSKDSASLIVVKGRRRIGKSRLLEEFSKIFQHSYIFSGLVPTKETTAESQRKEFVRQYKRHFACSPEKTEDWGDLFWQLALRVSKGKVLVVLDEITWMGSKDSDFLGKLKNAWDLYFKKNDQVVLVLCGSISSWIEENILSSTGFLGRESLVLTLEEMPLSDCVEFWGKEKERTSASEKLKMLSITGGIPRYLENMNPSLTAEENIQKMCFNASGILFNEFEKIFSDLFLSKNKIYKDIVSCLVNGISDQATILEKLKWQKGGDASGCFDDLVKAGFLSRDYTWKLTDGKISNLSHYRLKDNYSRFYLKYILPNRAKIQQGNLKGLSLSSLKGWLSILGLQVENLILSNRDLIKAALRIDHHEIISDNPFFQRKTARQKGCQIDYLIQTKHNVLYVCEIKFSTNLVDAGVIDAVKEKINRVAMPRRYSYRPVLIHVNGVSDAVQDSQYFSYIINFGDLLNKQT